MAGSSVPRRARSVRCGQVRAHAVVLAAGGFVMNREMVARYAPALDDPVIPVGAPHDDGSAIMLGHAAGGALRHMDGAFVSVTNYPPAVLLEGILVNREGRRFVAEDSYHRARARRARRNPTASRT